jgi:HEAT repeat protein
MVYSELVASLREPSTRLQVAARIREALPESCEALIEGLEDGPPSVRRWCAVVLDHAPHDTRIEQALQRAATDRNRKVRRAALHALACAHCKPDGCLTTDGIGFLVRGLLHDHSLAVRRTCAGALMWGQAGREERIVDAFRQVLATDADQVLRERAATFLASLEVPREGRVYGDWVDEWRRRVAELVAT